MKKIKDFMTVICYLVAIFLTVGPLFFIVNYYFEDYSVGDINKDGSTDISDMMMIRRHMLEIETLSGKSFKRADINKDGYVNQTDLELLSIIVRDKNGIEIETVYGDVNGDGIVSVIDLAKVKSHMEGYTTLSSKEYVRADLNKDGIVNSIDVGIIKSILEGERQWVK
mgnify:FL=1